jgi:hypothetical protein
MTAVDSRIASWRPRPISARRRRRSTYRQIRLVGRDYEALLTEPSE